LRGDGLPDGASKGGEPENRIIRQSLPKIRNSCYNNRVAGIEARAFEGEAASELTEEEKFYLNRP
jgi:hypothetical protein